MMDNRLPGIERMLREVDAAGFTPDGHSLPIALDVAIPLHMAELAALPSDQRFDAAIDAANTALRVMDETGEAILYRRRPGESARAFNAVAKAIAALAFSPGGITIFGRHWEAK